MVWKMLRFFNKSSSLIETPLAFYLIFLQFFSIFSPILIVCSYPFVFIHFFILSFFLCCFNAVFMLFYMLCSALSCTYIDYYYFIEQEKHN